MEKTENSTASPPASPAAIRRPRTVQRREIVFILRKKELARWMIQMTLLFIVLMTALSFLSLYIIVLSGMSEAQSAANERICTLAGEKVMLQTMRAFETMEATPLLETEPLNGNVTVIVMENSDSVNLLKAVRRFRRTFPDVPAFAPVDKPSDFVGEFGLITLISKYRINSTLGWVKTIDAVDTPYILIAQDVPQFQQLLKLKSDTDDEE